MDSKINKSSQFSLMIFLSYLLWTNSSAQSIWALFLKFSIVFEVFQLSLRRLVYPKTTRAKFRSRTSHEPNCILMRENKGLFSFTFDLAHVKYGVWTWPNTLRIIKILPIAKSFGVSSKKVIFFWNQILKEKTKKLAEHPSTSQLKGKHFYYYCNWFNSISVRTLWGKDWFQ